MEPIHTYRTWTRWSCSVVAATCTHTHTHTLTRVCIHTHVHAMKHAPTSHAQSKSITHTI